MNQGKTHKKMNEVQLLKEKENHTSLIELIETKNLIKVELEVKQIMLLVHIILAISLQMR